MLKQFFQNPVEVREIVRAVKAKQVSMFWTVVGWIINIYLLVDWLIRIPKVGGYTKKYVFITGCDTGFGKDLAIRLDSMGFHVFASCLTEDGAKSLSETCSSRVMTLILDVTDSESFQDALEKVTEYLPEDTGLWAVVSNAGVSGCMSPIELCDMKHALHTCDVNLFGPIMLFKTFAPLLRKGQGRIINMTGVTSRWPFNEYGDVITKYGLDGLSDIIRRDVALMGVKVCIIQPGQFRTDLYRPDQMMKYIEEDYENASEESKEAYPSDYLEAAKKFCDKWASMGSADTTPVVDAYVASITSKWPRPRYVVGGWAKFVHAPLAFFPEFVGDYVHSRLFPSIYEPKLPVMGEKSQ